MTDLTAPQSPKSPRIGCLLAAAVVLLPLAPLLIFPHANFSYDWFNQIWEISYWRKYVLTHFHFPATVSAPDAAGMPQPIFYGTFFYPLVTAISIPFGADWAIRILIIATGFMQFFFLRRVITAIGGTPRVAFVAVLAAAWAVYPMTNLYSRGAIAEFLAPSFLCSALCAGMLALQQENPRRARGPALIATLLAVLAFGSHPPTAAMGGLLALIIAPVSLALALHPQCWRRRLAAIAGLGAWVAVIMSPWLYATLLFSGHLAIQQHSDFWFIPQDDSWPARLQPLPFNHETELPHQNYAGTPFLDAQFSYPLLLLALCIAVPLIAAKYSQRDRQSRAFPLLLLSVAVFAVALAISSSLTFDALLPMTFLRVIQFPFRLVTYQNLALLTLIVAATWLRRRPAEIPGLLAILIIAWATAGVAMKLADAVALRDSVPVQRITDSNFLHPLDYADPEGTQSPPDLRRIQFKPLFLNVHDGDVTPTPLDIPAQSLVATDLVCFPWNHLVIDGQPLPIESTLAYKGETEAFLVPPGHHVVGYEFDPDPAWLTLKILSKIALLALLIAIAASFRPIRA
jgi:hypothetical protein